MKKVIKMMFTVAFLCIGLSVLGQAPPPPPGNPKTGGGGSNGPVGAPIDSGLSILIVMGIAYGGLKYYLVRKKSALKPETKEQ
jgi:hypothetical protein